MQWVSLIPNSRFLKTGTASGKSAVIAADGDLQMGVEASDRISMQSVFYCACRRASF
jgi:hypothetical protein